MTLEFVEGKNRRVEVPTKNTLHENEIVQTRNGARDALQKRLHGSEHHTGAGRDSDEPRSAFHVARIGDASTETRIDSIVSAVIQCYLRANRNREIQYR